MVIVSFTAYPNPGALIATAVTIPPDVVRSTVNPVPEPDAVVATPTALLNPVPPDKLPELRAVTLLIAEAAVTVIVQLLAEVAPFKLAPGITMVSFCKYPLPAEAVVALYPGLLDMLNVAPTPLPLVVPETAENVAFVPTMSLVNAPLRVTVLPVMSVTRTAWPSPLLNTSPGPIPVVVATSIVVSPIEALACNWVEAAVPPEPATEVICVPATIPVPDNGAPIGGGDELKPIVVVPEGEIKLVVIVPELPADATLKLGEPTPAPV
jgi:hypothetical protein